MLAPLARGTLFLVAICCTTFFTMLMVDGVLEELYGLAFTPIYLFQLIIFIDLFLPAYTSSSDDLAVYRQSPKEARYTRCTAGLNYTLWLIITILTPMRFSEYDTVPATAIGSMFVIWLALVLLAQNTEKQNWQFMTPFRLRRMAEYFSVIMTSPELDFENVFSDEALDENESSNRKSEFDPESEFGEQRGTVRAMSVRDSLRGSPPPTEEDLNVLEDPPPIDLSERKGKEKQVIVQIDQSLSEQAASGLEIMATDSITLEEAIMK